MADLYAATALHAGRTPPLAAYALQPRVAAGSAPAFRMPPPLPATGHEVESQVSRRSGEKKRPRPPYKQQSTLLLSAPSTAASTQPLQLRFPPGLTSSRSPCRTQAKLMETAIKSVDLCSYLLEAISLYMEVGLTDRLLIFPI